MPGSSSPGLDEARIAALLEPFLLSPLAPAQLDKISTYVNLLLRWNARINLTAVLDAEEIVTRHFGESLFAAQRLFPQPAEGSDAGFHVERVADVGSGPGFPGLPIKLWEPRIRLTLIESNHKKAAFLREVIRSLALADCHVFCDRAEGFPASSSELVTLRAVERFDSILPVAAKLVSAQGRLALLIGRDQVAQARDLLPDFRWDEAEPIPLSERRILIVGGCTQNLEG